MRRIVSTALLAVAGTLVACGTQDREDSSSLRSIFTAAGTDGAEQSATGHVEFIGRQGGDNRYSFAAIKRVDPVTGETVILGETQYQSLRPDGTFIDAHGSVICLEIVGNVARFGAEAKHVSGVPEGTPEFGYFTVMDNGEGADDPPDLASNLFAASEATVRQHCATGHVPPPLLFPNLRGNIQVRP